MPPFDGELFLTRDRRETNRVHRMLTLKNRFHGTTPAFCSVRCRRNCAAQREKRKRSKDWIRRDGKRRGWEQGKQRQQNHCLVALGRTSSCYYVTIVYSNPKQLPRALFISSFRYPLCNWFALLWQTLTGPWLWCGPVKHIDQLSFLPS